MSLCVLGMAEEFRERRHRRQRALAARRRIATAAVQNLLGGDEVMAASRTPEIMADAAHWILASRAPDAQGTSSSTRTCSARPA